MQALSVSGLTLRQAALLSGLAYLLNPVTFAEYFAMPRLVVEGSAQTLANLQAHPHLYAAAVLAYFGQLLGSLGRAKETGRDRILNTSRPHRT